MVVSEIPGIFDGPGIKWDGVLEPTGVMAPRGGSSSAGGGAAAVTPGGVGSIMGAQHAALVLQARFRGKCGRRRGRGVRRLGHIAKAVDFDGENGRGAGCGIGGGSGGGGGGGRCVALSRLFCFGKKQTSPAAAAGDNSLVGLVYRESSDDEEYEVVAPALHTENSFLVRRRGSASGAMRKNCVSGRYLERKQLEAESSGPAMRCRAVAPLRKR